ncbi:MAG: MBL fold metallo-hydrolase [Candidatus Undinarchaeales archaeon]|jgi:glyoxylase-like metal-dependent hydrolase (beta-lactamase superfamily II)|nr:MBL fold metallo-hydrolase [Candidatus Undinarchaeales archaeon]MDP7493322.1 MBL fold metallo-hydrolase [Candidatus Undinarchaeales archaeon]
MEGNDGELNVRVLGMSAAEPWNGWDNHAIEITDGEHSYLIDAGSGKVAGREYDAVFITHYHIDHTQYLFDIKARQYVGPDLMPHDEFPEAGVHDAWERPDHRLEGLIERDGTVLDTFDATGDPVHVYEDDRISVHALPTYHSPLVQSASYLIENKATGNSLWVSGDFHHFRTGACEDYLRSAAPSFSLVEATFYDGGQPPDHQNLATATALAGELGLEDYRLVHLSFRWDGYVDEHEDVIASPDELYSF